MACLRACTTACGAASNWQSGNFLGLATYQCAVGKVLVTETLEDVSVSMHHPVNKYHRG